MASREELAREFEEAQRELEEMAEEFAELDERLAEMVRLDIQVGDTRDWLDRIRERHAGLEEKYARVRTEYEAVVADKPDRTH